MPTTTPGTSFLERHPEISLVNRCGAGSSNAAGPSEGRVEGDDRGAELLAVLEPGETVTWLGCDAPHAATRKDAISAIAGVKGGCCLTIIRFLRAEGFDGPL
jgi:hypothetical protein